MRKIVIMILTAVLVLNMATPAFSSSAPEKAEADPNAWRNAYLNYISNQSGSVNQSELEIMTYSLMYITDDEIPALYIYSGIEANGGWFCWFNGSEVVDEMTVFSVYRYVEGSNIYSVLCGRMGQYYEYFGKFVDGQLEQLASCEYGGDWGVPFDRDTDVQSVNTYYWNDDVVSREEYAARRNALIDPTQPIREVSGYDGISYDEICQELLSGIEGSADDDVVSGVYLDTSMEPAFASQIAFDGKNRTFIFNINLLEAWGTARGSYVMDSSGIIDCKIEEMDFDYGRFANLTDINISFYGDSITFLDSVWQNYCGPNFQSTGQSFCVEPDSGMATITGDAVRVRSGPSTDYRIFAELFSGDQVQIIGRSGDWYQIKYNGDYMIEGFMSAEYVAKN